MVSRSSTYHLNPTPMSSNLQPESRPGDYDDITRLRLQLHQAELQRDAFEKALRKEVLEIIRSVLADENARLREENMSLQARCDFMEGHGQ